jgi:hypothetical protein
MAILDPDPEPGPHYGKLLDRKHGQKIHLTFTTNIKNVYNSVPNPEPYVFGASRIRIHNYMYGYGSVSISFKQKSENQSETFILF